MTDLFHREFRIEIETILKSFLEKKKAGELPTIAKYDIPRIGDLIAIRIIKRLNKLNQEKETERAAIKAEISSLGLYAEEAKVP